MAGLDLQLDKVQQEGPVGYELLEGRDLCRHLGRIYYCFSGFDLVIAYLCFHREGSALHILGGDDLSVSRGTGNRAIGRTEVCSAMQRNHRTKDLTYEVQGWPPPRQPARRQDAAETETAPGLQQVPLMTPSH